MKTLFLALSLIAAPFSAQAADFWTPDRELRDQAVPPGMELQKLFNLESDRDEKVYRLNIMVDKDNLASGIFTERVSGLAPSILTPKDGISWLRDIESKEGAALFEMQGKGILILQGKLDRATQEGRFQVRYLANYFSGNYETCDMFLKKNDKGWFIQNADKKKVTVAKIITWTLGVTTIEGICPKTL